MCVAGISLWLYAFTISTSKLILQQRVQTDETTSLLHRSSFLFTLPSSLKHGPAATAGADQKANVSITRFETSHKPTLSANISWITLTAPGHDALPLDIMLPYHLQTSSQKGRARFSQIIVIQLLLKGTAEAAARQVDALQQHGITNIVPVSATGLRDAAIFGHFFADGKNPRLRHVGKKGGRNCSQEVCDIAGLWGLDKVSRRTPFRMHSATNTLGMITALERCPSTYCVFMDPDILVHKPQESTGWVDAAVAFMEADDSLAVLQAPLVNQEQKAGCRLGSHRGESFSQRYFLVHRERLQRSLPVKVSCAPDCDTFEAFFLVHKKNAGAMWCSKDSSWVIHPPDDKGAFLRLIQSCAAHLVQPPVARQPFLSTSRNRTDRHWMEIPSGDYQGPLSISKKLESAAREGLPRFLDRVAKEPFGHKELSNEGQDVSPSLTGWLC